MDPTVIPVIALLFVALPAVVFHGIRAIKREQYKAQAEREMGGRSGGEMRASELKALVRSSVDEAVHPLQARITDLEERLGDESVQDLRERVGAAPRAAVRLTPHAVADAFDPDAQFDEPAGAPAGSRRTRG